MPASQRDLSPRLLRLARAAESDADLLARFVRSRDEFAFATLVERHGPMVLGVCRRALGDVHAADDAFQTTFLALARNAGRVRDPGAVAAWLYGTAVRVARHAQRAARRTAARERNAPRRPRADPLAEITGRELVAAVDEELARLPEPFRAAVVLCCIDGLSQDEAARRLGWSPGSVKGRLERGRERLRRRLMRRGIALSSALALLSASRAATATLELFPQTVRLAVGGVAPLAIESLVRAVAGTRALTALAVAAAVVLAAGGIATVGGDPPPERKPPDPIERLAVAPRVVDRFGDPLPDGAVLRLGTTRLRHADVCALAFTADKSLVSFGRDYVLRTWDPATGRQLAERAFEKDKVHRNTAGYLSADAARLAVQYDDRVKVFDVASGRELAVVKLADRSLGEIAARFSPDGGRLAVVEQEGRVHVLDIAANTSRLLGKVAGWPASDLAFSRDGKRLALATLNSGLTVWDLTNGREPARLQPTGRTSTLVDFDATSDVLAVFGSSSSPEPAQFVRVSTGQAPDGWTAPTGRAVFWARFAPDGKTLLIGTADGVRLFDPQTGKDIRTAAGPATVRPAFSADGKLIASGRRNAIRVWYAESGKSVAPPAVDEAPAEEIHGVAVSPDGKWVVTRATNETGGPGGGIIRIWEAGGKPKGTIRSNRWGPGNPVVSPDARHLYGLAPDALALARWELPDEKESARYVFDPPPGDDIYISMFGLSQDGRRLAAITRSNRGLGGPGPEPPAVSRVTVWDTATAERLESREVQGISPYSRGTLSPDLRWYFWERRALSLTGGPDYGLELPDEWQAHRAAVSVDGRLVAQAMYEHLVKEVDGRPWHWSEPRSLVVHETATGKRVLTLPIEATGEMAFTPDGRGLVVTDPDGITRWDLSTQKPVVRHKAPGRFIGYHGNSFASSLGLFADGNRAVTGHIDTTTLVWDLTRPARTAKKLSDRELASAWDDLAGNDAVKAYFAIWSLADAPGDTVPFLRARLRPAVAPTADEIEKLIGRLDSAAFADREAAEKELRELGESAVPVLRGRLKTGVSTEQKERIEKVLAAAAVPTVPPGERLRQLRAVAVLEQAGTAEARALLDELARGAPEDRLTKEAASVRERAR